MEDIITNNMIITEIQNELFRLADADYKSFNSKLIPNIPFENIIGVRTPALRKYAKIAAKNPDINIFLDELPHKYYEENNLHGFIIEQISDYDKVICELNKFLPYVDNWATCDMMSPKIFVKHLDELKEQIEVWVVSSHTYMVRFAMGMIMKYYLDENYDIKYTELVLSVKSDEYYIKMMQAWYLATALAKQYDKIIPIIEERKLDKFIHNKTIQKAIESLRIDNEKKQYLRSLKIV